MRRQFISAHYIVMHCPKCGFEDTKVVDSRLVKSNAVRRRRVCAQCEYRFSTTEEVVRDELFVVKRDGGREPFCASKIVSGIQRATEKRPIEAEKIDELVARVIERLEQEFDADIPTPKIGEYVMQELKAMDPVAYIRFASVYQDFDDIQEFQKALSDFKDPVCTLT